MFDEISVTTMRELASTTCTPTGGGASACQYFYKDIFATTTTQQPSASTSLNEINEAFAVFNTTIASSIEVVFFLLQVSVFGFALYLAYHFTLKILS